MRRIESFSSISSYNTCPRRYYYRYIEKLPTTDNIYKLRGNLVHTTLEKFFDLDVTKIQDTQYQEAFMQHLHATFVNLWAEERERFLKLGLTPEELQAYFDESALMVNGWLTSFMKELQEQLQTKPLPQAFEQVKPRVEEEFFSKKYGVRGYIDVIKDNNGEITISDYKTSLRNEITEDYKLQLAIYALLYYEKYKQFPDKLAINFLMYGEQSFPFTPKLLSKAIAACKDIHEKTVSDKKEDYPLKKGPYCKFRHGQCDYYEQCFGKDKGNT